MSEETPPPEDEKPIDAAATTELAPVGDTEAPADEREAKAEDAAEAKSDAAPETAAAEGAVTSEGAPASEEAADSDGESPAEKAKTLEMAAVSAPVEAVPGDGVLDELAPLPEATDDHPEDIPPDPGSADAASPRLQSIVESLLFAADKALTLKQLGDLLGESELARVRAAVAAVEQHYASRGFQLHQVAGGYQFRTNPENANWVQKLLASKPVRLTRAQLETLAICAYRQPITRPEIDEIRGVDSGGTLKTLMERALVRILGKKEEPGRPMLYGTTKEFLEFFNLGDLKDLPTLREFHELSEEHQAQVAALDGIAPEGSVERAGEAEGGAVAAPDAPPPLKRLEIATPPEDEAELEEIDRLIRTAGANLVTDQDQPPPAEAQEFEGEPTREFDKDDVERTQLHHRTIPTPHIDDVDGEFDRSETTNKKPRPEGLAAEGNDDDQEEQGAE